MDHKQAAALLREQDNILILTHKRPDGDTLGCAVGLCHGLRALGKTAWLLPNREATTLFAPYLEGVQGPEDFVPQYVVSVDTASPELLPENARPYRDRVDLSIDHHPSHTGYAKVNYVEADKASCGEILYQILTELGPLTPEMALPLYVAVSTDTGCFVYSNTRANTHRVAAALMEVGIDYQGVNKRHFRTKSLKRLQVESMLLARMRLYEEGTVAVAAVTLEMAEKVQAREEDLEDIASFLGQIEGIRHSVTIRQLQEKVCKISLRTANDLNASDVCAKLGGGGHAAAAGCTVSMDPVEAERAITRAIRQVRQGS